jgi:mevalonate kinase
MPKVAVKAPAVIKWFGEHAVVYGKPSVGGTVALYATTTIGEGGPDMELELKDLKIKAKLDRASLKDLYRKRKSSAGITDFVNSEKGMDEQILPFAMIAARLQEEHGVSIACSATVKSSIPMQRGFASSATCSVSFTVALLKSSKIKLEDEVVVDIAREGERISHKNEGAGVVDVNTSYYGGCISYSKSGGIKSIPLNKKFKEARILLIDTGPKKSTAETVGAVSSLMKADKVGTQKILDDIERCTLNGMKSLSAGNMEETGKLMYENQEALRRLGVSSEGLDRCVSIAKANGAYGAKLSGGGGGGLAIVLVSKEKEKAVMENLKKNGFGVSIAQLIMEGAKYQNG